jgi:hypothetical protein
MHAISTEHPTWDKALAISTMVVQQAALFLSNGYISGSSRGVKANRRCGLLSMGTCFAGLLIISASREGLTLACGNTHAMFHLTPVIVHPLLLVILCGLTCCIRSCFGISLLAGRFN